MSTTIRISTETRTVLSELVQMTGLSMQAVLDQAIDMYRRQQMLMALNDAYAALQADQSAWNDLEAEREEWDATLHDELEQN
ncbi:MAG: toxin-antitoxin system protein [Caldilinea sp. CFX5]|nr:toxin-antitoxin system protein [Caldilinea sp. CFX5]